ncbi:TPR and ankyrin repeat-containing protein 1, partial [Biomphalaria pfeifferi]
IGILVKNIDKSRKIEDKLVKIKRSEEVTSLCSLLMENRLPVIPKELLKMSADTCRTVLEKLIETGKWTVVYQLVSDFRRAKGERALSNFASMLKLADIIRNNSHKREESEKIKLVSFLVKEGASVEDEDTLKTSIQQEEWQLCLELLKLGVNPNGVTLYPGDTPYHAALRLALEKQSGDFSLLKELKNTHEKKENLFFQKDINCLDGAGNNLLHLAAQAERNENSLDAVKLLCSWNISSDAKNDNFKLPCDYLLDWDDSRSEYLKKPEVDIPNKSLSENEDSPNHANSKRKSESPSKDPKVIARNILMKIPDAPGFLTPSPQSVERGDIEPTHSGQTLASKINKTRNPSGGSVSNTEMKDTDLQEIFQYQYDKVHVTDFENLAWEIECTETVWNMLKRLKTQDSDIVLKGQKLERKATECFIKHLLLKIQQLGTGDWSGLEQTKVAVSVDSLQLFKLPLPMETCILWELAVAFSHRNSEAQGSVDEKLDLECGMVYSEVIRIWEIVLDPSDVNLVVDKISNSHSRGQQCIIQKLLIDSKGDLKKKRIKTLNANNNNPRNFLLCPPSEEYNKKTIQCYPPASLNKNEFNIIKLYNLSSSMVSAILSEEILKIDFPFKVAEIEHQIISLKNESPILLLGRSGTGKTTCCLYRLYKEFENYWKNADEVGRPLIPKDFSMIENLSKDEEMDTVAVASGEDKENDEDVVSEADSDNSNDTHDHLHQIFVTKNPVLCAAVEKNFTQLCQTDTDLQNHVKNRTKPANRLQDTDVESFPLFLTSKHLLLLLDASADGDSFFPRDEDLEPEHNIPGWETPDDIFHDIGHPLLEIQIQAGGAEKEDMTKLQKPEKKKKDFRPECTYDLFEHAIWPKLKNKMSLDCHPSLIWTEIMSFIKGSNEALETEHGYLDEKQYINIGSKRAPNFNHDRQLVYLAFEYYKNFMKKKNWFDETDVIFHIYTRIKNMSYIPWSLHAIYTDETQDFSQAELALLVSLSSDPKNMFLAGDTAQSIMRGISFRFADLNSLFYLKAKYKSKRPCTIYQLSHNYRSHTGILSMASALLDIVLKLFPDSIDKLEKDQGLFQGPKPVLIESCKPEELMNLLAGNKRDTSHIEFGAHQAVLVLDDDAKEKLPQELRSGIKLTIYESKGLEFDDILIYNFFTNSKVDKEWRVVTGYLEKLVTDLKSGNKQENLKIIDSDVLEKGCRLRPLSFDSRQHKLLDTELKQLYTAVTRARVNVWIFDENSEKRAPMFEYFKALKLVQDLEEFKQNNEEKGFMETSTPQEWKSKGDKYLSEKKYRLAIDCYVKAKEPDMEKLVKAFLTAEEAPRLAQNVTLMKNMYVKAGAQFLTCRQLPHALPHAARCFEKAEDKTLAAKCYEKCCQFEKAAQLYMEVPDIISASRCYQQIGNFGQAIDILASENLFERSVECLHTYQKLIQEYQERNQVIPPVLLDKRLNEEFTENKLWMRLAEHQHKNNQSFKETLQKVTDAKEKIDFFKKINLWKEAAILLFDEGDTKQASELMFKIGELKTALDYAKQGFHKTLAASIHMALAHSSFLNKDMDSTIQNLKEAQGMYIELNDNPGQALAKFYMGKYLEDQRCLVSASKHFGICGSIQCVGQLECFSALFKVTFFFNKEIEICNEFINYISDLGCKVIEVLHDKKPENALLRKEYLKFYGLELDVKNKKVTWHPHEFPLYQTLVNPTVDRSPVTQSESEAVIALSLVIISRIKEWSKKIMKVIQGAIEPYLLCHKFKEGFKCDRHRCRYKHKWAATLEEDTIVLNCWTMAVWLDSTLHSAAEQFEQLRIPDITGSLVQKNQMWLSAQGLVQFVTSTRLLASDDFQQIMVKVRALETAVKKQLERYVQHLLGADKVSVKDKLGSVRGLVEAGLVTSLLKIENINLQQYILPLETFLNESPETRYKEFQNLLIFRYELDQGETKHLTIKTIGSLFVDSLSFLFSAHNPMRSVFEFNTFLSQLVTLKNWSLMPRLDHLLFWMEFHFCTTLFTLAHANKTSKNKNRFYLPNLYLGNIKLVEACINGVDTGKSGKFFYQMLAEQDLSNLNVQDIQTTLVMFLVGSEFNLIDYIQVLCGPNPSYELVERILILTLVVMLNIPKELVSSDFEIPIRGKLYNIKHNDLMPERLKLLIKNIQKAKSYPDLVTAISFYLSSQGDFMMQYTWLDRKNFQLFPFRMEISNIKYYPQMVFFKMPAPVSVDPVMNPYVGSTQISDQGPKH